MCVLMAAQKYPDHLRRALVCPIPTFIADVFVETISEKLIWSDFEPSNTLSSVAINRLVIPHAILGVRFLVEINKIDMTECSVNLVV